MRALAAVIHHFRYGPVYLKHRGRGKASFRNGHGTTSGILRGPGCPDRGR